MCAVPPAVEALPTSANLAAMALVQPLGLSEPDAPPPGDAGRVTPMMEQYIEIKTANPDCLLFYRMGDFYELFFEDAETASRALGIMLTKRGKHLGQDIPMCGVPVERADEYLHRLIALGHRVAVCEQLEDPAEARKRGPKSVVRRDVVRLVTPGTLTEDTLLDAKRNNYLLAIARARASAADDDNRFALSWIDISTGEFRITECERNALSAEIARLEPSEIIVSDALYGDADLVVTWRALPAVTPLTRDVFDGATAERRLTSFFAVATSEAFGALSRLELTAAAACVTYVERTQIGKRPPLSPPLRESAGATMAIDQATRGNLELMRTLSGERRGSLLEAIDRTVTSAGSRLLAQRLSAPLTDPKAISRRLDAVASFVDDTAARAETRSRLKAAPDLARALARLAVGRGGPRDLAAIRDGVLAAAELARALASLKETPAEIAEALQSCRRPDGMLAAELSAALAAELPAFKRDGGFVREGYDAALDETRGLRDASRRVVASLQTRYAEETGVRGPQDPAQQCAGLFRRGHRPARRPADGGAAQCHLHPPPDACRPGALHLDRARRTGGEDRQRRRAVARAGAGDIRAADSQRDRAKRDRSRNARRRSPAWMWRARSLILPPSATMRARRSTTASPS